MVKIVEGILGKSLVTRVAWVIELNVTLGEANRLARAVNRVHQLSSSTHGIERESASVTEHVEHTTACRVTLKQSTVLALINKETSLLSPQLVNVEFQAILNSHIGVELIPSIISANMFLGCTSLKGAIAYNNTWINGALANPDTGYFTKQWTLHVGNIEHGTVRLSEATPFTNELVTITLTPDAHYRVKNFTLTGNSSGFNYYFSDNGDGTYTFIMPPEDITLSVEFFCPTANAI